MNAISRIGQKVVCIVEIEITTPAGGTYNGLTPVLNDIYTVTGFGPTGMLTTDVGLDNIDIGITLAEIPSIYGRLRGTDEWTYLAWPLTIFRPVDERKTDISDLVRAAKEVSAPEPVEMLFT